MTLPANIAGTHVLVTGGAGFIGSHTVDLLMSQGAKVSVLDNLSSGYMANLAQWDNNPRFCFVGGDVTKDLAEPLAAAVAKFGPIQRIAHYAAQTAVPVSMDDPVTDIEVNLAGTARLLEYARRHKVAKVAFASSSAVYDDDAPVPVSEESSARPASPYGIDKLAVEIYLDYYTRLYGLKFTALRFMNVYGPRQDPSSWYSGVISIFLDKAVAGEQITIFDDGEQTRDFVYVTDVATAVVTSLFTSKPDGAIINIGTGVEVTINEITRTILALAKSRSVVKYQPPRAGDIRRSVTTMDRARALLDFAPKVDLREGLDHTLAWVRTQKSSAA
ncbi:MAG: SDR family NAD(P)-dependent oxidoreductase [Rhodospirillaceae bacterium]|nr:SDR family NAD(P)-dependent oxidoreductase [Rhodospirillaceae bacterium]